MEKTLRCKLTGTRPLIMHNARLANPLDSYTRALKPLTSKQKKKDEELAEIASIESRGAMYETEDGNLGMPAVNVWRSIYDAAKAFKKGEDVKRGLRFNPSVLPLEINGGIEPCDPYIQNHPECLLYVSVVIQGRRVMRARPIIQTGWSVVIEFTLLTDVLNIEHLEPIFKRAGRLVGLCDWRPIYGTYSLEVLK